MATTNLARFTINGTPSEDANGRRGYDASANEVLTLTLEANPAFGLTVTYEIYDPAKPSSPLTSLYASSLVFTENNARSISLTLLNSAVHIAIPSNVDISSYTIRATVVTAVGAQIFERLVCVRRNGLRMTVPAESTQYSQRGWSDALNELTHVVADGGVAVMMVTSSASGTIAAFPSSQRRIFHSDGTTSGGVWTALAKVDVDSALASASIDVSKITPSVTNGHYLRTVEGVAVWAASSSMTRPTTPTQDDLVAIASNGDLIYETIGNSQISAGANIAVTKLAASATNGFVLTTIAGVPTWAANSNPTMPTIEQNGLVPIANNADFTYSTISNIHLASDAGIAVTKLAASATNGFVLTTLAGIPTWAAAPSLPVAGDHQRVAFANSGTLDYATAVRVNSSEEGLEMRFLQLHSYDEMSAPIESGARLYATDSSLRTVTSLGLVWEIAPLISDAY